MDKLINKKVTEEEYVTEEVQERQMSLFQKWFKGIKNEEEAIKIGVTLRNPDKQEYPQYKTEEAFGADVSFPEEVTLKPFERKLIPLDMKLDIPKGYAVLLVPRGSTGMKNPLMLTNSFGVIDSDYKKNVFAPVMNLSPESFTVKAGRPYFQFLVMKHERTIYVDSEGNDTSGETEERKGGLGSTSDEQYYSDNIDIIT